MPLKNQLRVVFASVLAFAMIACKTEKQGNDKGERPELTAQIPPVNLTGQVMMYAPEMDITTCEALAQCDCCAGIYLFIDDRQVIQMDYCEGDRRYRKGTYEIRNQEVTLRFEGLVIDQLINRDEEGVESSENRYVFEETNGESSVITLTQLQCEKNLAFDTGDEMTPFATLVTSFQFSDVIRGMKEEGVWSRLKMN